MITINQLKKFKKGDKIKINNENYEVIDASPQKIKVFDENDKIKSTKLERPLTIKLIKWNKNPNTLKTLKQKLSSDTYEILYNDEKNEIKFFKLFTEDKGDIKLLKRKIINIKNA